MKHIQDTIVKEIYKSFHQFAIFECSFCLKPFEASKHEVNSGRMKHCGCSNFLRFLLPESIHGIRIKEDLGLIKGRRRCIAECPYCSNDMITTFTDLKAKLKKNCGCQKIIKKACANIKLPVIKRLSVIERLALEMNTSVREIALLKQTYQSMKARCYRSSHPKYHRYGGRGIYVCERWLNSFELFVKDMGLKTHPNLSIDRVDNDGIYEPSNCKWSTVIEQNNNTVRNKKVLGTFPL